MTNKQLIKITLVAVLVALFTVPTTAQTTDAELQNTYWYYRHKLRTEFMKVGEKPGHSIPAASISKAKGCGELYGNIGWGDATIDLGEYIAVLATEYRLLKNGNQDVTATLNELYYALKAVERLDEFAEVFYLKNPNAAKSDGFFVRDDVPYDMYQTINRNELDGAGQLITDQTYNPIKLSLNFQNAHRESGPVTVNDYTTEGVIKGFNYFENAEKIYTVNTQQGCWFERDNDPREIKDKWANAMSQDQVYGLVMGFYAVMNFVDSDVSVQPKNSDQYINMHAMTKVLTERIVDFVSKEKTVNNAEIAINDSISGQGFKMVSEMTTTWFIYNPSDNNQQVRRGTMMWPFAKPIAKIATEITGKYYNPEVYCEFSKPEDRLKLFGAKLILRFLDIPTAGLFSDIQDFAFDYNKGRYTGTH